MLTSMSVLFTSSLISMCNNYLKSSMYYKYDDLGQDLDYKKVDFQSAQSFFKAVTCQLGNRSACLIA